MMRRKKLLGIFVSLLLAFLATCSVKQNLNEVQSFKMLRTPKGIVMIVHGTRHPTYTVFRLTDPLRIVVDIAYTDVSKLKKAYRVKDNIIRAVKVYQYGNKAANVARFEIYLKQMKEFIPRVEDDTLVLIFPSSTLGRSAASEGSFIKIAQNEGENILEEDEGLFEEGIPESETAPTESTEATTAKTATSPTAITTTVAETAAATTTPSQITTPTTKTEKTEGVAQEAPVPSSAEQNKEEQPETTQTTEEEQVPHSPQPTTVTAEKEAVTPSPQPATTTVAPSETVTSASGETEKELFGEEAAEEQKSPPPATATATTKAAVTPPPQQQGIPELEEQQKLTEKALGESTTQPTGEEETEEVPPPPAPSAISTPAAPIPAPQVEEKPTKPSVADKILDINVDREEKSTIIKIIGNGPIGNYNVFKLTNPARLVVDLWNVGNLFPTNQLYIDTPTIKELRLGQHPEKLRAVIEFKTSEVPDYTVNKVDDSLEITISEIPPTMAMTPEEERKKLEEKALGAPSTPSTATAVPPPPPPEEAVTPQGEQKVAQETVPPPEENVTTEKEVSPPPPPSPPQQPEVPKVAPTPAMPAPSQVPQEQVSPGAQQPTAPAPGARRKIAKKPQPAPVVPEAIHKIEQPKPVISVSPNVETELSRVKFPAPKKKYRGRRISLDFKDADIHNVLRLLAEVSNLNIIASSDVKGKVTVRMVNVPWDQALDVILQTLGLGYVRIGNVIRVAPRKELEQEEKERLQALKNRRELEPLYVKIIPVNYGKASEIAKQVKPLLSKRGSISVDSRTNVIIVKDILRNIKEVETLIHNLDTQTPQVLIEARIVEASTNFTQELGIQWGGKVAFGSAYGTPTGLNFPANGIMAGYNPTAAGGGGAGGAAGGGGTTANVGNLQSGYVVDLPAAIAAGAATSLGLVLGSINNSSVLDLRLSAIEDSGEGRIISSPRITTLDNREAIIEQGYSIPYETVSQSGTQTQFIDATLKLRVTPHITADRNIILDLDITKDAPETSITSRFGIPSISKKEAKTQILLHDGETAVIGGIFQIDKSKSNTGVPLLSKLPVIGWLFRRSRNEDKRTELLIFMTPRIIQRNIISNK